MSRNAKGKTPQRRRERGRAWHYHMFRRRQRRYLLFAAILLAGSAAAAFGIAQHMRADAQGDGTPTVVQIHDPSCPVCRELRSNVLRAAEDFSEDTLQIRFADLHTDEGQSFALRHSFSRLSNGEM